ncbi:TetR family transcriptional regulator [Bacillus sp. FJAT-27231]|uniref:TetR/AcrR family transcriptional regulator n=1 Tax=Bacillus sp. FJAT-27231 TaxID=1679168 RepID=UPI000670D32B|nr:TetR/AcrR family transcriptional regulator [Bacillus sp. FJAT-27231]KMY55367.1 TetR family transcriptional regulator [Bacillus sp. FJAT-27231]
MYEAFEKQPQAKKDLILQVAIEEFVKNGYEKTSTDIITSRAGISKGILFHYFKSKKNLYVYLASYVIDLITKKTIESLDDVRSNDFFERIKEAVWLKQEVTAPYKQEMQFITDVLLQPPKTVKLEVEDLLRRKHEAYGIAFIKSRLYPKELIDESRLRPGVTKERVIQMTAFIVEQLSAKYQTLQKNKQYNFFEDPELLMSELDAYLDIVKHGVYKPE